MGEVLGTELNSAVTDLFEKKISTGILASVNQDATPHTSPVSFMIANNPKSIRMAIYKNSQTLANIRLHEPVALALLEEGNIAVSIYGKARIVQENMESNYNLAIVELEVEEVKNNSSPNFIVVQGIRARHSTEPNLLLIRKIFTELLSFGTQ